jgi:hypothetical protein
MKNRTALQIWRNTKWMLVETQEEVKMINKKRNQKEKRTRELQMKSKYLLIRRMIWTRYMPSVTTRSSSSSMWGKCPGLINSLTLLQAMMAHSSTWLLVAHHLLREVPLWGGSICREDALSIMHTLAPCYLSWLRKLWPNLSRGKTCFSSVTATVWFSWTMPSTQLEVLVIKTFQTKSLSP